MGDLEAVFIARQAHLDEHDVDGVMSFFAPDAVFAGRAVGDLFEGQAAIRDFVGEWFGATAGLGMIYTFDEFLRPAIQSGALVPVLHEWWENFSGPFLYY